MTSIEQQIALLRDALRERARNVPYDESGYSALEYLYQEAAGDADALLTRLADITESGGVV